MNPVFVFIFPSGVRKVALDDRQIQCKPTLANFVTI